MTSERGCETDLVNKMNEGYKARGSLKSVLLNFRLNQNAKKCYQRRCMGKSPEAKRS